MIQAGGSIWPIAVIGIRQIERGPESTAASLMDDQANGWLPVTAERALVLDVLHYARGAPLFPVERPFDLGDLAALRRLAPERISWCALFLKAYGMVSAEHDALRRMYRRWPWPHFYQHGEVVITIAIHREHNHRPRLCWGRITDPQRTPLVRLQRQLDWYATAPVEKAFRTQLRLSRLPTPLRRAAWRLAGSYGPRRAKHVGTGAISTLAGQGALNRFHPTVTTTSLNYGPLDENGRAWVTLLCDHRVADGYVMANALAGMEKALVGPVQEELASLATLRRAG